MAVSIVLLVFGSFSVGQHAAYWFLRRSGLDKPR
jgi:hypothetical protein